MNKAVGAMRVVVCAITGCLWAAVFASPLIAADGVDTGIDDLYFDDLPVVMTATRLRQSVADAPAPVTVIDRRMIEAAGVVNIVDVFRLVPGFQVAHFNSNLGVVSAHGTAAPWFARFQVLVDGHSAYNAAFSGLDWTHLGIALDDVERIEVVRGPSTPTYGANAVQGAINIITRKAAQDQGWSTRVTSGSRSTRNAYIRYANEWEKGGIQWMLEHRQNDGFPRRDDGVFLNQMTLQAEYYVTERDELDIRLNHIHSDLGVVLHFPFDHDDRVVKTYSGFSRWTRTVDSDESFYLQASTDQYDSSEDTRLLASQWFSEAELAALNIPDQSLTMNHFNVETLRHELEFQHMLSFGRNWRWVWGVARRWDDHQSDILDPRDGIDGYSERVSGNLEWRGGPVVGNLGAMAERTNLMDARVSPRLGFNYKVTPYHTARLAVTRAYKSPSLQEANWRNELLNSDGTPVYLWMISQPDLAPERRDVVELGMVGHRPGQPLEWEARLYHEEVDNAVIYAGDACLEQPLPALQPAFCYRVGNFMRYDVDGFETAINYRPNPRRLIRLNYAYGDAQGKAVLNIEPRRYQDLGPTVPRHLAGLLMSQKLQNQIELSSTVYYVDETYWYIDGHRIEPYTRIDLRVAKTWQRRLFNATVELMAHNVTDDYYEFRNTGNVNLFETRYFLRMKLRL